MLALKSVNLFGVRYKSLPLLKADTLKFQSTTSKLSEINAQQLFLNCQKLQVSINLELVLDMTKDVVDMAIISKTFTRRWKEEYAVKDNHKQTIIDCLSLDISEMQLIWS